MNISYFSCTRISFGSMLKLNFIERSVKVKSNFYTSFHSSCGGMGCQEDSRILDRAKSQIFS
ncbi:hypothetical protein TSAR_002059 [Trichomalopsis sarcophagae]|uniref:Uncharacterized protein n=1 Tax=Trichomalopsis sarcophagae TaxID=543379 RepID=A0A232F0S1_9HYME|nr:hypothetical protein TSAR_002059 [Trichomalopsis sarcophagae]